MGETQQKEIFKVKALCTIPQLFHAATSQKLLESLHPDARRELKDNIWLKREVYQCYIRAHT